LRNLKNLEVIWKSMMTINFLFRVTAARWSWPVIFSWIFGIVGIVLRVSWFLLYFSLGFLALNSNLYFIFRVQNLCNRRAAW
jgi:hypothetical protein